MTKNNFTDYAGYCDYYTSNDFIAHFGILGMKWGVRRYQNPDGSLTEAGLKRYGYDRQTGEIRKLTRPERRYQKYLKEKGINPPNPNDEEKLKRRNLAGLDEKSAAYELENRAKLSKEGFNMQINGNGIKRIDNNTIFAVNSYGGHADPSAFNLTNYQNYMKDRSIIDKHITDGFSKYVSGLKTKYVDLKENMINPMMTIKSQGQEDKLVIYKNADYGDYLLEFAAKYDLEKNELSDFEDFRYSKYY